MGGKGQEHDRYEISNGLGSIIQESGSIGAGRPTGTDRLHHTLCDYCFEHLHVIGSKQGNLDIVMIDRRKIRRRFEGWHDAWQAGGTLCLCLLQCRVRIRDRTSDCRSMPSRVSELCFESDTTTRLYFMSCARISREATLHIPAHEHTVQIQNHRADLKSTARTRGNAKAELGAHNVSFNGL